MYIPIISMVCLGLTYHARVPSNRQTDSEKKVNKQRRLQNLHSGHMIIPVAGDMKPRARVNKGGIPALQNIVRIRQAPPQSMKGITWKNKHKESTEN